MNIKLFVNLTQLADFLNGQTTSIYGTLTKRDNIIEDVKEGKATFVILDTEISVNTTEYNVQCNDGVNNGRMFFIGKKVV